MNTKNILVQYDGGGYDGCIWEFNFFYIDKTGKFYDIFSSGVGGITTKNAALDLLQNMGNSFSNKVYIYNLDDKTKLKEFATECNACNVRSIVAWFNQHNDPDAEPFAICSECGQEITDADDICLATDFHGCGGLAITADTLLCSDCYYLGQCDCCNEYDKTTTARTRPDNQEEDYMCDGCVEDLEEQEEQEEQTDMAFSSFLTGDPDMFSNEMRWFWNAE